MSFEGYDIIGTDNNIITGSNVYLFDNSSLSKEKPVQTPSAPPAVEPPAVENEWASSLTATLNLINEFDDSLIPDDTEQILNEIGGQSINQLEIADADTYLGEPEDYTDLDSVSLETLLNATLGFPGSEELQQESETHESEATENVPFEGADTDDTVTTCELGDSSKKNEEESEKKEEESEKKEEESEKKEEESKKKKKGRSKRKMDLSLGKKLRHNFGSDEPVPAEAAEGLMLLSRMSRAVVMHEDVLESESESQDSSNATSVIVKRHRLTEDNGSVSQSGDDGDTSSLTPKIKGSSSRSSRRRKKKEFMHQKEDPTDPIAQRAKYAKSYRERKKQEHEIEVNGLKQQIAVRDAHIKHLTSENEKMTEQLTKATLTRHETVQMCENVVSAINAVKSSTGIDVVIKPGLGNLNSPKLSEKECEEIAKKELGNGRFTLEFDYSETEKKVKAQGIPPNK